MAIHIRRREFIFTLGSAAAAWPVAARAQQPAKVARIGFLGSASASLYARYVDALRAGRESTGRQLTLPAYAGERTLHECVLSHLTQEKTGKQNQHERERYFPFKPAHCKRSKISQEHSVANNKNPNQKQPGEKEPGTLHYNPGNMSGKTAERRQDKQPSTKQDEDPRQIQDKNRR